MTDFLNTEFRDLKQVAPQYHAEYNNGHPFPNIYFRNFFNPEMLDKVLAEFPDLSKRDVFHFDNPKEKKLGGKGEEPFGPETKRFMHYLNSQPFLEFLQTLTGIEEVLMGDPYFVGGGLHEIKRGGLLKIHADFNKHPTIRTDRRINALVYLNKGWKEEYGGHFELWDRNMEKCEKKILPEFNTLAIFSTTAFSYHGHPNPLNCPEDRSRKSLALYYYTNGRPAHEVNEGLEEHSTLFKARPGDKDDKESFAPDPTERKEAVIQTVKDFIPPVLLKLARKLRKTAR